MDIHATTKAYIWHKQILGYRPAVWQPFFLFFIIPSAHIIPSETYTSFAEFVFLFFFQSKKLQGNFKTVTLENTSQEDLGFRYQSEVSARWLSHAHKQLPTETRVCVCTDHWSRWLTAIINVGHIWLRAAIKCSTRCDLTSWSMVCYCHGNNQSFHPTLLQPPFYPSAHSCYKDTISQVYLGPHTGRVPGLTFLLHNRTNEGNKVSLACWHSSIHLQNKIFTCTTWE